MMVEIPKLILLERVFSLGGSIHSKFQNFSGFHPISLHLYAHPHTYLEFLSLIYKNPFSSMQRSVRRTMSETGNHRSGVGGLAATVRPRVAPRILPKRGGVIRKIVADFRGGGGGQVAPAVRQREAPRLPPKRGRVMKGILADFI
ncbi:hypothetical protein LOK49_Contig55G00003 [Camellia lanceoleosa]|nr:hypothetical protein LOK49_Contig55G00003 [Camellia lanceoleosa]